VCRRTTATQNRLAEKTIRLVKYPMDRREFFRRSETVGIAAGLTILPNAASVWGAPANERLSLAVVGLRNRGLVLASGFSQRADCRITYLCDADSSLEKTSVESIAKAQGGVAPVFVQDFRKALDDASVDALVIATPDHWHCLATIWACEAKKDVFVTSPLSHDPWEGRRAVEAARKHQRIVAADLATRSSMHGMDAKKFIESGRLGKIHFCRVNEQSGQSNFRSLPDTALPDGLDWNAWNGPAAETAYNANLQNNWHGYWQYSGGNAAVEGVHQLDLARWLCGVDYPLSVTTHGARYDTQGVNETPDTIVSVFEFADMMMAFELTLSTPYMTRISQSVRTGDVFPYWPQCGARVEIYGSEGLMLIGPHGAGWQVFVRPRHEQPTLMERRYSRPVDPVHQQNFVDSVRNRKPPSADVEEAHRSALLVHYANMSYRSGGGKLHIDPKSEGVDSPEAMKYFRRTYRKPWVVT
jgi:predicted dehydrogenase